MCMQQTQKRIQTVGRQLCWLPLDAIHPNRLQPRVDFDRFALLELAEEALKGYEMTPEQRHSYGID